MAPPTKKLKTEQEILTDILEPNFIAGHNVSSTRAFLDDKTNQVVSAGERELFYFDASTGNKASSIRINAQIQTKLKIVSFNHVDRKLYLFTNKGSVHVWNLDQLDWTKEFKLPIGVKKESIVSALALDKTQFIFSLRREKTDKISLNYCESVNERKAPLDYMTLEPEIQGKLNQIDFGALDENNKLFAYVCDRYLSVRALASKYQPKHRKAKHLLQSVNFSCVRANKNLPMVAAGDNLGRIFLYSGDLFNTTDVVRSQLHWHQLPVNDLCFSSTSNLLYSCGGESGCVVIWDLTPEFLGQKRVVARLGMPIRFMDCAKNSNTLVLSHYDNELQIFNTTTSTTLNTVTSRAMNIYEQRNMMLDEKEVQSHQAKNRSIGLVWHPLSKSFVVNGKIGELQFCPIKSDDKIIRLNLLNEPTLILSQNCRVLPSDICKIAFSKCGTWLAAYELREAEQLFPEIKLHIWKRAQKWEWVQTIDRLHDDISIKCLKFSPNGRYIVSISHDGLLNLLHRISFDAAGKNQMYVRGYFGKIGDGKCSDCAFSQDASILAMSSIDERILLYSIKDCYNLVHRTNLISDKGQKYRCNPSMNLTFSNDGSILCEIRKDLIRVWNIIDQDEFSEYICKDEKFIAAGHDYSSLQDYFATATMADLCLFSLQDYKKRKSLVPLLKFQLSKMDNIAKFVHLVFVDRSDDTKSKTTSPEIEQLKKICLATQRGEIAIFEDKLNLRYKSGMDANRICPIEPSDLHAHLSALKYKHDKQFPTPTLSRNQRMARNKQLVKTMIEDVILKVPSHEVLPMDQLGPRILDTLFDSVDCRTKLINENI